MILILLSLLLIAGITLFQSRLGLYRSLIMAVLAVLAAVVAFNYYEPLAKLLLVKRWPSLAEAIALAGLFAITLLVLRHLADSFLDEQVNFGTWIDRIGGGVMGLITALICVGVLMIAIQMLPFGPAILGYKPYDSALQRSSGLAPFYPDRFTAGMVDILSKGGLSARAGSSYATVHPDLLRELFATRNRAGAGGPVEAAPGAISVTGAYKVSPDQPWAADVPADPLTGDRTGNIVVLRVRVTVPQPEAQAHEGMALMPGTHFELLSQQTTGGNTGRLADYPLGYLTYEAEGGWQFHPAPLNSGEAQLADLIVARPVQANLTIDWVYRLPAETKPSVLRYRGTDLVKVGEPEADAMPPSASALARVKPAKQH